MKRYPLARDLGLWRYFSPPLSRPALALAHVFQPLLPKGLHGGRVSVSPVTFAGNPKTCCLLSEKGAQGELPCLIYFHGGGFVYGAARHHYRNAAAYAAGAGCRVLFVGYPLAPRAKYPEIFSACLAAYRGAVQDAAALGIDRECIAVGGDSAGGFLAADVALRAGEEGLAAPCFAMLVYPVVGGGDTPSMRAFPDTPMWNARANRTMWQYVGAQPSLASHDLSAFPSAYLETAQFDCLHDEGINFARALRGAGVEVLLNETRGTMHGFDIAGNSRAAQEALSARISALRAGFARGRQQ